MDLLSSRLEDEDEVESPCIQIPNDDVLTEEDDLEIELVDKEDNDTLYKMINGDDKVEEPKKLMMFSSKREVSSYYKKYAKQAGFAVIKRAIKKGIDDRDRYITLACIHQGKPRKGKSDASKPVSTTNRTECKAKICATLCSNGKWFLSKVVIKHNHCLSPEKTRVFRCQKNMDTAATRRLVLNDRAGIRMNKNFNSLFVEVEGYKNILCGEKDCQNFIDKAREFRFGKGGVQALRDYFSRMQNYNDGFYYVMDIDDDGRLRSVFWADARSRAAYEFFGDAIMFDTTYLTNRYDMLFAYFVGVNHHGQSIFFGAGLISNKNTETFVWLFDTWLGCMNGKAPGTIITDWDRAMKNATARVFPNTTRHRYCLSHIMRKLLEQFAAHAQFNGIKSALHTCLYDSQRCDEFEKNWKSLLETYQLQDNAWLHGLYSERTFWVPAYMKDTFLAGINTTQWSESMNAFFDDYVHLQTTSKEFVDQFDSALRKMVEKEEQADFDSFNHTIPCIDIFPIEKNFQDVYTNAKFKEVKEEFLKVMTCNNSLLTSEGSISTYQVIEIIVTIDQRMVDKKWDVYFNKEEVEVKCTCALFETRGILCSHIISVLISNSVIALPSRYFLTRWRKDIKRKYTLLKSCYDAFGGNPDDKRYDIMCKNFFELASLAAKSEDNYKKVMKNVDMLIEEFHELSPEPINHSHHISVAFASSSCNEVVQSNDASAMQSDNVLSPIKVERKGRPPLRRKVPIVEKVPKKLQVTNKSPSNNNAKPRSRKKQTSKVTQDQANISQTPLPPAFDNQHGHIIRTPFEVSVDPTKELSKLVYEHNFEKAFNIALQRCDVSIVSWLCSQVDLRWILSVVPLPLSQRVLLSLLWQLACDINNNLSQKIAWMTVVANAIIPTDPGIAVHVHHILFQVHAILNHQCYLLTIIDVELSNINFLMHVINSKLFAFK